MTVDLRAIVACDLGPIISGDLGANHISDGSGLVITSGRVTIDGLITPARGTDVNLLIGCPQLGRLTRFPKRLRVIRAVTHPLDRRTEVEIGCQLALMKDRKDDASYFVSPDSTLNAQELLTYCLQKISLTQATGNMQLSGAYQVPSVDLSQGYLKIIGDLVRSERCFGRLRPDGTFEVVPFDLSIGRKGPVWTADDLVSIEPISTGSEPPDVFRVMYKSPTQVLTDQRTISSYTKEDETISPPQEVYLRYTTQSGQQRSILYVIRARSISKSTYEIREWTDASGKKQQSDVLVLKRDVKETALGAINSSFLSSCLRYDLRPVDFSTTICNLNETRYQYKATTDGLIVERETTEQKASPMEFAAGMQVPDYVKVNSNNQAYVYYLPTYATSTSNTLAGVGDNLFVTTRTIVENQTVVDQNRTRTRTKTSRWLSRGLTQEGQQEFQWALKGRSDNDVVPGLVEQFRALKFEGTELQANEGKATSFSVSLTGNVLYAPGQPPNGVTTTATYELPYTPISGGNAAARAFGEVESSLEVGHAYGFNIVTSFDRMPSLELSPIYVRYAGLEVAFLADSVSYAFDASGMVVSSDLMVIGVTGYYGSSAPATSWVRMAVSPSGLGAAGSPTIETSPAKANSIAYPSGFDPLNPGDWFTSIGSSGADVFAAWKSGAQLIGPTLGQDDAELATGPVIEVLEFEYALNTGIDQVVLATGSIANFIWATAVAAPAAAMAMAVSIPKVSIGVSVIVPAAGVAVAGVVPVVASGASVLAPATTVAVAGVAPDLVGRQKTIVNAPSAVVTLAGQAPEIRRGVAIPVPVAIVAISGGAPSVVAGVTLLLHMNGTNASTSFVDSSTKTLAVTANGNARISTAQSKFGGASGYFDGSGDYLSIAYSSAIDLLGSNFTLECWVYPTSVQPSYTRIMGSGGGSVAWNTTNGLHWIMDIVTDNKIDFQIKNSAGNAMIISTAAISLNAWNHVAVSVIGSTAYIAVNGTVVSGSIGTVSRPSTNPALNIATIPNEAAANVAFNGYVDDLRITKGIARYTANFTPPADAFPDP